MGSLWRRLVYLATYLNCYCITDTKCSKNFVYILEYSVSGIGYPSVQLQATH